MSKKQAVVLKTRQLISITNIVLLLAVGCLCVVVSKCEAAPIERVEQQVHLGMPRDEAIPIIQVELESWYHQPCPYKETIEDLFFFESQLYDEAQIIILTSELKGPSYKVVSINDFETYAWHTAYKYCYQKDKFIHTD